MSTVIVDDFEYDASSFLHRHPGGEDVIRSFQGIDATDVFREFHPPHATKYLNTLPRKQLEGKNVATNFEQDMRNLSVLLEKDGYFKSSSLYYTRKLAELLFLFTFAMRTQNWYISSFICGVFFQQAGWLAHDFAHNQVTYKYKPFFVTLVGTLCQGFTGQWWIPKHMMHHARPNAVDEHNATPWDTDIDTAPFIYWVPQLLPNNLSKWSLIMFQGYYLWLVLFLSKFVWDYYSFVATCKRKAWGQVVLSILHHVSWIWFTSAKYYVVSRLWAGFLIGWVFIMSHNGTEYYIRPNVPFYESQIRTTRNLSMDPFTTWFTGGLNYQIEHHMFPKLPRHNLGKVATKVRTICEKYGFTYSIMSMWECSKYLTSYLNNIWRHTKKE